MIVITGAAGFIGSALVAFLNENNVYNAVLIDDFSTPFRLRNLAWKHYGATVQREDMINYILEHHSEIEAIVHLGAKAGYFHENWEAEKNSFMELNRSLWKLCTTYRIPFIYASTGSVYGSGEQGFRDDKETSFRLKPVHPYVSMRLEFDNWALTQQDQPPVWMGMRISNVYGPNEYHKMKNASMAYKGYNEILSYGTLRLFASHKEGTADGGMVRDFIYVKDVVKVIWYLLQHCPASGIYNIGSGTATSFNTVAEILFRELQMPLRIEYEPIPDQIRDTFPYYSLPDTSKLISSGYTAPFTTVESGIREYIDKYLSRGEFY